MIDLHVHLLPAIDDGSASPDVTKAMLARARDVGFTTLVATPHLPGPLDPAYREQVEAAHAQTQTWAATLGIDVQLGYEVTLTRDLPARLEGGEPCRLAGSNAVLVDLPFTGWPHHAEQTFFALQTRGFRPVLAHVERYTEVQRDPARALRLVERGVVLQVTISSLVGLFGKAAQRTAELLLRQSAVHVVATDAHSEGHRFAVVPNGLARLDHMVGEDGRRRLLVEGPNALLASHAMPVPPMALPHRRFSWRDALTFRTRVSR